MYILLNESGSGFGPDFNSSYELYVISRNTTYDNESKVSVKLIHILILIFICLVCVIIPFFYNDIIDFLFNIKSKCRTIHLCSCKKCKTKIEPIFYDCHSMDTSKDNCTICLSVNNQKSITLRCEHKFHEACIKEWAYISYEKTNNAHCPLCRKNIFV
jgi:hypothetical protein